jgi:RND family efflux transporter MFP subunit
MKILFSLIITGLAIIVFLSCKEEPPAEYTAEAVCVKAVKLPESERSLAIEYPGVLSTKQVIRLSFKTGGIIDRIYVNEGSRVNKGQVIATLNMTEISSQAGQAKLAFEKAERDLDRIRKLYSDTVTTLEQLQDATSAYNVALENLNIAQFNLQYSKITAPANGKILARLAEEHELIGPGMPVLIISEQGSEQWIVKSGLSDRDIVRISTGDKAEVGFDAFPGKKFAARVSQIDEMVDPQTGTFGVEVTVEAGQDRFMNGMIARVSIKPEFNQSVTMVPSEAIVEGEGQNAFVFVVNEQDSTALKVPVTIAWLENNYIAVREALNEKGSVITEGASYIEDGTKINFKK